MNPDKTQTVDFKETQMEEAGIYRCVIENKVGKAETTSNFMVAGEFEQGSFKKIQLSNNYFISLFF